MEKEKNIIKAYVSYTGKFKFDERSFRNFLNDFSELNRYSKFELKNLIKNGIEKVRDEMDPKVNSDKLKELLITSDLETEDFLKMAHNKYLSDVVEEFKLFPFKNANNKTRIKNAILTIYGEDLANSGNDDLGNIPEGSPAETEKPKELPPPPTEMGKTKTEEKEKEEPQEALDPKVEEDVIFTMEKYLAKDIFNSKLIPTIKVIEAYKVKNGYVVKLEFSSSDEQVKAFAHAVVHNNKLIPPAELEDEEGNVIGSFSQETFLKLFSIEPKKPKSDSYNDLMDQMISSADYTQAGLILKKIAKLYGEEIANNAFDSFVRIKTKRDKIDDSVAIKLNVKIDQ